MGQDMRLLKGDLSAPVLAVIVTIGVISAGLVIMAWFWWFAPLAGRTGALMIVGTPVIFYGENGGSLTIAVRNTGNADVRIEKIVILGKELPPTNEGRNVVVEPGATKTLTIELTSINLSDKYTVEGVIIADTGVYTFTAKVIKT